MAKFSCNLQLEVSRWRLVASEILIWDNIFKVFSGDPTHYNLMDLRILDTYIFVPDTPLKLAATALLVCYPVLILNARPTSASCEASPYPIQQSWKTKLTLETRGISDYTQMKGLLN